MVDLEPITQCGYGVIGVFWLGTYMALLDKGWLWWVSSVGAVPAALTGFAVGSLALFPGLPTAPLYTLAHFKCHTRKHNKPKSAYLGRRQMLSSRRRRADSQERPRLPPPR